MPFDKCRALLRLILYMLICSPFITSNVLCQSGNSTLKGLVLDQQKAAIAGATIIIKKIGSGLVQQVITNNQGLYILSNLSPGDYLVEVKNANFSTVVKEVTLKAEQEQILDFQLTVGTVKESVTIKDIEDADLESVPGGTATISQRELAQSKALNLKDIVAFTPGVIAQPRFGFEQSRISVRGSGLRSNFHLRGINILINDQPYQDADGFTDLEAVELTTLQRVDVWKGANALRFGGNSMGGAINFITKTGETSSPLELRIDTGSYGFFRGHISTGGVRGSLSYYLSFTDVEFDGFREHSEQGRQRVYGNMGWKINDRTRLNLDLIYGNAAEKMPGALTREEFLKNPRQADRNNVINDWGRFTDTTRVGVGVQHQLNNSHEVSYSIYGIYRNLDHPIFQTVDQDARNFGGEIRYRFNGTVKGKGNRFVVGFRPQLGLLGERRFENRGGQRGARTALFDTVAQNYGLYVENQLDLTSLFTLVTGGRADWATRRFEDQILSDGDRSDRKEYSSFSPKLGFVWRAQEDIQIFANVSRSYEAPLILELSSFGAPGFLDLKAQDTWQFEVGTRGNIDQRVSWDLSFFDAEIRNEILNMNVRPFPSASFTVPSYRNAKQTRHVGIELGTNVEIAKGIFKDNDQLNWNTAYTWSHFHYINDPVYINNQLPGAPKHLVRSELRYTHPTSIWISPNIDWSPATYFLNSANNVRNDKYAVLNLKLGYDWRKIGLYVEGANLTNRRYAASTQVDSATNRYFEPANGRSAYVGIRWRY
jgi:iron complex outermembrane recepter protein